MLLDEVPENTKLRIVSISLSKSTRNKLNQMSLFEGATVCCARRAPLGGPVLINVSGREIAIGKKLARKIVVEIVP